MPTLTAVPDLSGAPLDALKQWLAITATREDALLLRQLGAAYETCGQFVTLADLPGEWDALPAPLREGIVRFAAYLYRERDTASALPPPAAVAALWRPYRALRL